MGELKDVLAQQSIDQSIADEVSAICDDFGAFKGECASFIDKYGPPFIQKLAGDMNATEICDDLGACVSA
jgi:hypothetical protein